MMKVIAVAVVVAAGSSVHAAGPGRGLGLGVILGNPTGVTGKYALSDANAVAAGVGFSGEAAVYADYLWNGWKAFPQPETGRLGAYLGLGGRVETHRDAAFGVRTVAGAAYWLSGHPVELFLEVVPVFRVIPDQRVEMDAGLGLRYYFHAF